LPPLRERHGDIPLLIDHFLQTFSDLYRKPGLALANEAWETLQRYDYPGNVRELENIVRRAVILCREPVISCRHLGPEVMRARPARPRVAPASFHAAKAHAVEEFEQAYLIAALQQSGGIIRRAAQRAGLSERNFHDKLKKYHISGTSYRTSPAPGA
jgi:DNA-binding NtrC family response regulator